jgi:outer membrane protein OmpA-like peptidoglycan-associated protein
MNFLSLKQVACVAAFAMVLGGCTTTDPYTGEQKTSKATTGAAIGAVTGAVIGVATSSKKDRGKGAAIGAVAGGAIGGGIGNYMDKQEAALRQRLEGSGVRVVREGDHIRLVMPSNITFGVDQDQVRSGFYDTLNSVALVLKEYDKTSIQVGGHTDSTGSDSYNQGLSERRADSVASYLIAQGVRSSRVYVTGYGERYPIASNDSEEGRQLNRRVELELIPVSQ